MAFVEKDWDDTQVAISIKRFNWLWVLNWKKTYHIETKLRRSTIGKRFLSSSFRERDADVNARFTRYTSFTSRVLKDIQQTTDQIKGVNRAIYEKRSTRVLHNTYLT